MRRKSRKVGQEGTSTMHRAALMMSYRDKKSTDAYMCLDPKANDESGKRKRKTILFKTLPALISRLGWN
jgi:hypothetical protein